MSIADNTDEAPTKKQRAAIEEMEREEARKRQLFRDALDLEEGRALLIHILSICNPMQIKATHDAHEEFEHKGRRMVGVDIVRDCLEYAPEHYYELLAKMTENLRR